MSNGVKKVALRRARAEAMHEKLVKNEPVFSESSLKEAEYAVPGHLSGRARERAVWKWLEKHGEIRQDAT
jgi:hypothetical protein